MASSKDKTPKPTPVFDHIFVNSPIDAALYRRVMNALKGASREQHAVLSLVTLGGSGEDAYRLGRFLQMLYSDRLDVYVPTVCASAGTLLACAGSRLIIGPLSELGPLDAQIRKSDELYGRRSGLVVRSVFDHLGQHAFELHTGLVEKIINHSDGAIKYRTAAHIAGEMVVGLLRGLYDQINPEQIGEDYRFLRVAEEYGKRLARRSGNISEDCLRELIYDFPSHDFIIDFREAARLFNDVQVPSDALTDSLSDGTEASLNPLDAQERIVRVTKVSGYATYEEQEKNGHGNGESEDDANGA